MTPKGPCSLERLGDSPGGSEPEWEEQKDAMSPVEAKLPAREG